MFRHLLWKTAVLTASLCLLSGCSGQADRPTAAPDSSEEISAEGSSTSAYRPADTGFPVQDVYNFPYLGLETVLPDSLLDEMKGKNVLMTTQEELTQDGAIRFAGISWKRLTEEQKDAYLEPGPDAYEEWLSGLTSIAALGCYQAELENRLNELTGFSEHKKLGQSRDGAYVYYLSSDGSAESAAVTDLIRITLKEQTDFPGNDSVFSQPRTETAQTGSFSTRDIFGTAYTQELFQNHDLTLVNVFATWCTPCVEEIPALEQLQQELQDRGVGVVGVVMDTVAEDGSEDSEALEKARILAERTGASYPFLIPDETGMNGRFLGMDAFPETFFVDRNGNIVSDPYLGAHSLEEWKEIVNQELAELENGR